MSVILKSIAPFLIWMIFSGCNGEEKQVENALEQGLWRGTLEAMEGEIPFNFNVVFAADTLHSIAIINGEEVIELTDVQIKDDSLIIKFPVFESEIKAHIKNPSSLEGYWQDFSRGDDYRVNFNAEAGKSYRFFEERDQQVSNISGNWETTFSPDSENSYKAIGRFSQNGAKLYGTFLTATGDYRYLEGIVNKDTLYLSTFDGTHAYLFKAAIGDTLKGKYYSGNHYSTDWIALRNENFVLPDADTLTYLKPGFDKFQFSFPDPDSNFISLNDEKYQNKVVLVQIMGTWCPNCMDESKFLADFYKEYNSKGVEIIGLAFERVKDFERAANNVVKLKKRLNINYDIAIAGSSNKAEASDKLPALNKVLSYPTLIFIGKDGEVKRIHTGFSGPATGKEYEVFKDEFYQTINRLLAES